MAMKTSGNLSIKTATGPGTDGEINTNVSGVNSGSLVTLGQNSVAYTGGTGPNGGTANTSVAPYGMREYYGYVEYFDQPHNTHVVIPRADDGPDPSARPGGTSITANNAGIYMWQNHSYAGGGFAARSNRFDIRFYFSYSFSYLGGETYRAVSAIRKNTYSQASDHRLYNTSNSYLDLDYDPYSNYANMGAIISNTTFTTTSGMPDSLYVRWIPLSVSATGGISGSTVTSTAPVTGGVTPGGGWGESMTMGTPTGFSVHDHAGYFGTNSVFASCTFVHTATAECNSTSATATGWLQFMVRKSGFADTAICTVPVYSFIRMTWTGAYCF